MQFNNYSELLNELSKDSGMDKNMKIKTNKSWEIMDSSSGESKVGRILKENEEGILISYPNEELVDKQFIIRRKSRYVSQSVFHKHSYIELTYVLKGEFIQNINGNLLKMKQGDLMILDKNTIHSISYLDENVIAVNFLFTEQFFDGIFLSLFSNSDSISKFILNTLYSKSKNKNFLVFHIEEASFLESLFQKLLLEYYDKQKNSSAAIHGYLLIIFTELSRLLSNGNHIIDEINNEEQKVKEEILRYIKKNFKNLTLDSIAEHFYFHPVYMSSFIKKSFGKNLQDIQIEMRLEHAKKLLENTDNSIEQIIIETGYNNKSHFYKLFKKKNGVTPNQYRKKFASE